MAKKRKAKKSSGSRRRRVSGVNASAGIQRAAMVIAGFAGGQLLTNAVESITKKTLDPKIKGAALLAAGLFGPKILKMKSPTVDAIALGISVRGGVNLLSAFGIKGLGAAPMYYLPRGIDSTVNGLGSRAVNGTPASQSLATAMVS